MQVLDSLDAFRRDHDRCVATIGKYDGMHLGHQQVLRRLLERSKALGLPSLAILSEPQPEEFFRGPEAPARLNHFWDKVDFLRDFGLDIVYRLHFNQTLSRYSPEQFMEEILVRGLGVHSLVVGDDFRFGRGRRGDVALLREYGTQAGFEVHAVPQFYLGGERVSSTMVRQALADSDFDRVRQLLGRDYGISGEVVKGRQLGRKLGIPTANLALESLSLPITGVYAVRAEFREQSFNGVANIGYRPTVDESGEPSLEVYLFDFDGDLYGGWLKVVFMEKLREEVKFPSIQAMQEQMDRDVEAARAYFHGFEAVGG